MATLNFFFTWSKSAQLATGDVIFYGPALKINLSIPVLPLVTSLKPLNKASKSR